MLSLFLRYGISAFLVAFFATVIVRFVATKWHIVDHPHHPKNVHTHPVPRLGGIGIFLSVLILVMISLVSSDWLVSGSIEYTQYIG
ncbi:MAG: hypothetical protein AAB664_02285, partial [Patescibacteria group bacterium]